MVGDPGIEPGVRLREGVTVPCHTLRPVAHYQVTVAPDVGRDYKRTSGASTGKSQVFVGSLHFRICAHAWKISATSRRTRFSPLRGLDGRCFRVSERQNGLRGLSGVPWKAS